MVLVFMFLFFFFSSRRRHTRCSRDWSSDVCSSDLRNLVHGWKSASAAVNARGQRSHGVAKSGQTLAYQPVDPTNQVTGRKRITCAGCINGVHLECRRECEGGPTLI